MKAASDAVRDFLREPQLPRVARRTFRLHLGYAVLDAISGGIISIMPVVAIKEMGAPDWQLGLSLTLSGVGMLATLYLSSWMACRPKLPFVFLPGVACAACTTAMALAHSSFSFLFLGGLGLMFQTMSRPAITAVLRLNYPATHRGVATGEIRKWSSLYFLLALLISADALDLVKQEQISPMSLARGLVFVAGLVSLASYLCFQRIHVREVSQQLKTDLKPRFIQTLREAGRVISQDARYRRYLLACFVFGFSGLLYVAYIPAFLEKDLHYDYRHCALLIDVIPLLAAFVTTGFLGSWFDRTNPWKAWAWIRFGWGLDPLLLAATLVCAATFPPAVLLLPVLGRISRGSVQGGSWVLWWQVGVNHFARHVEDTSRYQGILVFFNGLIRLTAPAVGAWILTASDSSRSLLFLVGGLGVIASGLYSLRQARREESDATLSTIADFEATYADRIQRE